MHYQQHPVAVSQGFRDLVISRYPALSHSEEMRRLMQYVLFSTFVDEETGDRVMPYTAVAALVGCLPTSRGFHALHWLNTFSADVLPLNTSDHKWRSGKARTIRPEIDREILDLFQK